MLSHLIIRNLTLIKELHLPLHEGLTVLTGETGAGKSVLLDALTLILGARASMDTIREGEDELEVTAEFILTKALRKDLEEALSSAEVSLEEEEPLLVRRIVARSGRHRQYVNGQLVTLNQLKNITEPLIDFTSQHAQHALFKSKPRLALMDAFAGNSALLETMADNYKQWQYVHTHLNDLQIQTEEKNYKIDWLTHQLNEIKQLNPQEGELELLENQRQKLIHQTKMKETLHQAFACLSGEQGSGEVADRLYKSHQLLQKAEKWDSQLAPIANLLEEAVRLIKEADFQLSRRLGDSQEPIAFASLEAVEDRLYEIKRVCAKHGGSLEKLFEAQEKIEKDLQALENQEVFIKELCIKEQLLHQTCLETALQLHTDRTKASEEFSHLVSQELKDLGMVACVFRVEIIEKLTSERKPLLGADGIDEVNIWLGANPGEAPKLLEKVASGGELSRVMLAIKRTLLTSYPTLVSVFDEVDTGLGGAIGEVIGDKLQTIAKGRQVICVTHLHQIAARANHHFRIEKRVEEGRTVSLLKPLEKEDRVEELARMMGGREVTSLTREHARECLWMAQNVQTLSKATIQ